MKIRAILIFLVVLGVTGFLSKTYSNPSFHAMDVTGHLPDLQFLLMDDQSMPVSADTYRGKVVLLYFGYTQCPSQCPMTMARLSSVLKHMGKDADKVQVLFVSIDPYDTPQNLHDFAHAFDPQHMSGLTGKEGAIKTLAKRYRAAYPPTSTSALRHSNAIYIFDSHDHARLLATDDDLDTNIADDLRHLTYATN